MHRKASCSPFPMFFPPTACFISTSRTSEKLPAHRFRCFFLQLLALSQPPLHRKSFLLTISDAFSPSRLLYLGLHYIGKLPVHQFRCFFLQPLALSQPPVHRKSFLLTVSDAFSPAACFISTSSTSESFLLAVSDAFSSNWRFHQNNTLLTGLSSKEGTYQTLNLRFFMCIFPSAVPYLCATLCLIEAMFLHWFC